MTLTSHDVVNPSTEQRVTAVDLLGVDETDAAVDRARAAFAT